MTELFLRQADALAGLLRNGGIPSGLSDALYKRREQSHPISNNASIDDGELGRLI